MEEYLAKFVNLIIKGDLQEAEEICKAHTFFQNVMKLSLKVAAQKVYGNSTTTKSVAKEGFAEDSTSKNPSDAKSIPKPQVKSKVHKPHQESTPNRCYKCQGLRHIASKSPN